MWLRSFFSKCGGDRRDLDFSKRGLCVSESHASKALAYDTSCGDHMSQGTCPSATAEFSRLFFSPWFGLPTDEGAHFNRLLGVRKGAREIAGLRSLAWSRAWFTRGSLVRTFRSLSPTVRRQIQGCQRTPEGLEQYREDAMGYMFAQVHKDLAGPAPRKATHGHGQDHHMTTSCSRPSSSPDFLPDFLAGSYFSREVASNTSARTS